MSLDTLSSIRMGPRDFTNYFRVWLDSLFILSRIYSLTMSVIPLSCLSSSISWSSDSTATPSEEVSRCAKAAYGVLCDCCWWARCLGPAFICLLFSSESGPSVSTSSSSTSAELLSPDLLAISFVFCSSLLSFMARISLCFYTYMLSTFMHISNRVLAISESAWPCFCSESKYMVK